MYLKKIVLAIVLLGLFGMGGFAFYVNKVMFTENTSFSNQEAFVYISRQDSYQDIISYLEPLLEDVDSFDALAIQKKYNTNFKSGKYVLKKGMNNNDIINTLRSKNVPVKITFNNQKGINFLVERISEQLDTDSTSLVNAIYNEKFLTDNKLNKQTVLSLFIPNSYELFWNTTAEDFRDRMKKESVIFWNSSRLNKAKILELSKVEVYTLASIVNEETKQRKEQPRVAGVYINRLKKGMLLQADPTIKYAAYQQEGYNGDVIRRVLNIHKKIDSPYNTYMNKGLPPGPIAMPDVSAIDAVLNYEKHSYLYFVADPVNIGYHKFAKSLRQHNSYAREYHKYMNNKGVMK